MGDAGKLKTQKGYPFFMLWYSPKHKQRTVYLNDNAMAVPCPIAKHNGKTLGDVLREDPKAIKWVADKFTGSEEIKAAAKLICEYALQQASA